MALIRVRLRKVCAGLVSTGVSGVCCALWGCAPGLLCPDVLWGCRLWAAQVERLIDTHGGMCKHEAQRTSQMVQEQQAHCLLRTYIQEGEIVLPHEELFKLLPPEVPAKERVGDWGPLVQGTLYYTCVTTLCYNALAHLLSFSVRVFLG